MGTDFDFIFIDARSEAIQRRLTPYFVILNHSKVTRAESKLVSTLQTPWLTLTSGLGTSVDLTCIRSSTRLIFYDARIKIYDLKTPHEGLKIAYSKIM
ncbi:hypothetical protein TNCV_2423221 [Trichonephila clavipes]|nr:hypothetical protein TNCV_2423221 [Trichonephila clavipes]